MSTAARAFRWLSALSIAVGAFAAGSARADLIVSPPHAHDPSPVTTWADGHVPIPTHQHQHRTDHDPSAGVKDHGGAGAYVATKVWVDRILLTLAAGPDHAANEFAHGHQDVAARFDVHAAVAGGDISEVEAEAWNAFAAALAASAVGDWLAIGNASGPQNWPGTDNDEAPGTGVLWHSSVNWTEVAGTGAHELHIIYGEAGAGNLGVTNFVTGHSSSATIIMDDDVDWFYGISTDLDVAPDLYDFFTTILHEWGHVVGLGHFGTNAAAYIMTGEAQPTRGGGVGGVLHAIDPDAVHGVRDLYAIAAPEPASVVLVGLGAMGLIGHGRRRGRRKG